MAAPVIESIPILLVFSINTCDPPVTVSGASPGYMIYTTLWM